MTLDAREFRDSLGAFATGITVVTANAPDGTKVGCTANSFSSVSLDPPLVMWAIAKNANSFDAFNEAKDFAIHILHAGQEDVSRLFATKEADKFGQADSSEGRAGVPVLNDYSVRFECSTEHLYDGGDHLIIVGRVHEMSNANKEPLGFFKGQYAKIDISK
ncbi:MAG: flavin reductase family protein [Gammaproteobacteria bacterium]|nr:flavin reductase family protein [Gammaproteobacteria bacterium]MBQ0838526.1 flavin reductase family protein [Gammaproteobacteria bacterium]